MDENNEANCNPRNDDVSPSAFTSVSDAGAFSDQNARHRRRMEDAHYVEDGYNGDPHQGFFGVYDGHGGKEAAAFASLHLHKVLAQELNKIQKEEWDNADTVLNAMKMAFEETDTKMKDEVPTHHGCTAVVCFLTGTLADNNRRLFTANCGDARAVLCRDGQAVRLTEDHKASSDLEAKRITDGGGFMINGRVNGQIAITRALGDHVMKEFIISEPHLDYKPLTEKDTHLIIACDGVWDVVSDQQACDLLLENPTCNCTELAKKLLVRAVKDGSTDNISVIVVKL